MLDVIGVCLFGFVCLSVVWFIWCCAFVFVRVGVF